MDVIGAIDIGGTKTAVGLVDAAGTILERVVGPTERERDFSFALGQMRAMLAQCLDRRPGDRLVGVGVGCTGPVDPRTGVLGPNSLLPRWEGIELLPLMAEAFGAPVAIENDADAAVLGEAAWGAGQGAGRCIYVTISTGIGCGIIIDGGLYRGAGGAHPEIGHLVIDPERGPACYCGGRGCWESLASGPALAAWYADRRREMGLPAEGAAADAREVCRRAGQEATARQEDPAALEAVLREGYYLGVGLANLITLFIPDVIVLGGGVMESWPLFEKRVRMVIRQSCAMVPHERTALRRASLGERTGLAGAAQVWINNSAKTAG